MIQFCGKTNLQIFVISKFSHAEVDMELKDLELKWLYTGQDIDKVVFMYFKKSM